MNRNCNSQIILAGTIVMIEKTPKQTDIPVHNKQCTVTLKINQLSGNKSVSENSLVRLLAVSPEIQDRLKNYHTGDHIQAAVDIQDGKNICFIRCHRCGYHIAYQREGILQMKDLEPAGDEADLNIVEGTFIVRTDPVLAEKEHDFMTYIFLANETSEGKEKAEPGLIWISKRVYKGSEDSLSEISKNNLVKIKGSLVQNIVQMRKCCPYCFHTFKKSVTVTEIVALEVKRI